MGSEIEAKKGQVNSMIDQAERFFGLPIRASEIAVQWDGLYGFLFWLSVAFFLVIVGVMIYFLMAYRHREGSQTDPIRDHHTLERFFFAIPTFLVLFIFAWGLTLYQKMTRPPVDAYEIRVIGKQWLWQFLYADGRMTTNEAFVPLGKPVKFVMISEDVLHSFFIPNFRVKQDVVPGMYTSLSFTATVPGKHVAFCTEFCGTAHSQMMARIAVLKEHEWQQWLRGQSVDGVPALAYDGTVIAEKKASSAPASGNAIRGAASVLEEKKGSSLASKGGTLYRTKGCVACHSVDGKPGIGPSHLGLFGRSVELADGRKMIADEAYLRKHIEDPQSLTTKGYSPIMPTFKGILSAEEIEAIIAYLKELKE